MARRWYHYEPESSYRNRLARRRQSRMDRAAADKMLASEVRKMGFDPLAFPSLSRTVGADVYPGVQTQTRPTTQQQVQQAVKEKSGGGGGIFGKVMSFGESIAEAPIKAGLDAADYTTAKIFGGEVREPWDILRPVKRAMDAEIKYVGKPVHRQITTLGAAPIIALREGMTLEDAYSEAGRRYTDLEQGKGDTWQNLVTSIGQGMVVPSSFIGPYEIFRVGRGLKRLVPTLQGVQAGAGSRRALRELLGLKAETRTELLSRLKGEEGVRAARVRRVRETLPPGELKAPQNWARIEDRGEGVMFTNSEGPIEITMMRSREGDPRYMEAHLLRRGETKDMSPFRDLNDSIARMRPMLEANPDVVAIRTEVTHAGIANFLRKRGLPLEDIKAKDIPNFGQFHRDPERVVAWRVTVPRDAVLEFGGIRPTAGKAPTKSIMQRFKDAVVKFHQDERGGTNLEGIFGEEPLGPTRLHNLIPEAVQKVIRKAHTDTLLGRLDEIQFELNKIRPPRTLEHQEQALQVGRARDLRGEAGAILDELAARGEDIPGGLAGLDAIDDVPWDYTTAYGPLSGRGEPGLDVFDDFNLPHPEDISDAEILKNLREIDSQLDERTRVLDARKANVGSLSEDIMELEEARARITGRKSSYTPTRPYPVRTSPHALMEDMIRTDEFSKNKLEIAKEKYIDELVKRQGLSKGIKGGANEPANMVKLLERLNKLPDDKFAARGVMDVLEEAINNRSLTQVFRNWIADRMPDNWVKALEARNWRLVDDDLGMIIPEGVRIRNFGVSAGAAYMDRARPLLEASDFIVDDQWKIIGLKGHMSRVKKYQDLVGKYLDDVGESARYHDLPKRQQAIIAGLADEIAQTAKLEAAAGLKVSRFKTASGLYFHREIKNKVANIIDPRTRIYLVEEAPVEAVSKTQVPVGPAVKQRFHAKQSFQRPREVLTKAEGIAAGLEYYNPLEAQRLRILQGYNKISDQWMDAALSPFGKKPSELLDPFKKQAASYAARKVGQLKALQREVDRAVKVNKKGAFFAPKLGKEVDPAVEVFLTEAQRINQLTKKGERAKAFELLQETLKTDIKKATPVATQTKGALTAERVRIMARGTEDYPRHFAGKLYPEQIGKRIQEELGGAPAWGLLENTLNRYNNWVRPIMATLDLSFLGVQGLLGLARNPAGYLNAARFAMTNGYDDFVKAASRRGTLQAFLRDGGHWATRNDIGEFFLKGPLTQIERTPFKPNTWFSRFGNVMRLQLYEAGMKSAAGNLEQLRSLARFANLATGFSPGKVSQYETAALFAPRFFRAQLGLLSDAFTTRKIGGNEAARTLASLVGLGSILTYGVNEAIGNPTEMDPTSPNFMRIRAFGKDISVFGTWDSLARAVVLSASNPEKGAKYILRSKASPAFARIYDILQGETFGGGQMGVDWTSPETILESTSKSALNILAASAPISAQQAFEEGVPTSPGEIAGAALQFSGTKATPLTESEELTVRRDEKAKERFNVNWEQLEPHQVDTLQKEFPDLKPLEAKTDLGKAFEARRAIGDQFRQEQEALDANLPPGPDWLDEHKKLRERQAGAYIQWEAEHPNEAARLKNTPFDNENDQALQQYYKVFDESKTLWGTLDPELLSKNLDAFEAGLSPAQQAYIDRNTGFKATDRVKEYRAAQQVLEPYWEIEDQVWEEFRGRIPEMAPYPTLELFIDAMADNLRRAGVPQDQIVARVTRLPIITRISSLVDRRRQLLRRQNPALDAQLAKWYGAVPITMQRTGSFRGAYASRAGGAESRGGYSARTG